jgi:alkylhydroperoxidase/carboxymuconolactone decarboxylase family protein YurZ
MLHSTRADRTLADLLTEINDSAAAYAMGRLLERRPDLDQPPEPRIPVPAGEDLRVSLDRLAYVAWLEQGLALASDVPVAAALRAGATWAQLAEALRCTTDEARECYDHLAVIAGNPPVHGPWDNDSDAGGGAQ